MTIELNDEELAIITDALESYSTQAMDASQDMTDPDERYERADLIRTSVLATSLSVRIKNINTEEVNHDR